MSTSRGVKPSASRSRAWCARERRASGPAPSKRPGLRVGDLARQLADERGHVADAVDRAEAPERRHASS